VYVSTIKSHVQNFLMIG